MQISNCLPRSSDFLSLSALRKAPRSVSDRCSVRQSFEVSG